MNSRLKSRELCPIHHSYFCCGRKTPEFRSRRGERTPLAPRSSPRYKVAVTRVEDEFHPRGFREICNTAEKRRRKHAHIMLQKGICLLCDKPMENYKDVEFCHKRSRGMKGQWTDDSMENTFAGHRWCNQEQGSKLLDERKLA